MVSELGAHIKYLPHGEIPYVGDKELDAPVHNGEIVLNNINQKVLVMMTFVSDFIDHAKSVGRTFPLVKKEAEISGVDKSIIEKAEKAGAIKKVLLHAKSLNGARTCYLPTPYGRAIIKEIKNVREQGSNHSRVTSDSGELQSSIGELAEKT